MFNVHLIRTEGVSDSVYDQITSLLHQFPGPMRFVTDTNYERFILSEDEITITDTNEDDYYKSEEVSYCMSEMIMEENELMAPQIPEQIKVVSWDSLFKKCRKYRSEKNIQSTHFVILLTELNNKNNWFSASDTNGENNLFIHTDQWDVYDIFDIRFPVAYLIATGILKKLAFQNYEVLRQQIHHTPKGCISDFCEDKREITLKMRTADICPSCMIIIKDKVKDKTLLSQCYRIMDHIQSQLRFRERFELLQQPSRILITPRNEPIQFLDIDASQLRLSPIEKAIFILFLEKPEGLFFNRMDEHKKRLSDIYDIVGHNFTLAAKINTLERITNPTENRLSEIVSRIRRKLTNHLGDELAEHYIIDGPNGEAKKIGLNRELVDWSGFTPQP
ncbi:MAG: hypothetical protein ACU4F9_07390 [Arcticibacter sp.]